MTANDIANMVEKEPYHTNLNRIAIAYFVRQQQAEIDTYKSQNGSQIDTYRYKELKDEEINVVAILQDAEIVPVGHEIWKTSEEFNKYKRIVLATAKALRKAQE